jgi:hypothetical protein
MSLQDLISFCKCKTSAFRYELCPTLRGVQCFGKHRSCHCHVQGEYVLADHFWQIYVRHGVGGALNVKKLTGGAEE